MKLRELSRVGTLVLGFLCHLKTHECAQAADLVMPPPSLADHFQAGRFEASAGAGVFFSPLFDTQNRPTLDYALTEVQLSYMLTDVHGAHFWRGNVEGSVSVFGGGIFAGRGSYVAGTTLWLRYNFVRPTGRLVPFVQTGAGVTSTDLDHRIEGQDFNFNLNLSAGARYFIRPNWSLNLEYRFQHISNDNLSTRNLGVNAHGPLLSLSYFF